MNHRLYLCVEEADFVNFRKVEAALARDPVTRNWVYNGNFDPNTTRTTINSTAWEEVHLIEVRDPADAEWDEKGAAWEVAGYVYISKDSTHRRYNLGGGILEAFRNQGLSQKIALEVLALCRNSGCEKLETSCWATNDPSRKMLSRHMKLEGTAREALFDGKTRVDRLVFGLTAPEMDDLLARHAMPPRLFVRGVESELKQTDKERG